MPGTIERVFVAGAGLMGHGIAQVHAAIGLPVTLYEPDLARAEAGRERIAGNLDRAVAKGRLTADERDATLARIEVTADTAAVAGADLVIEAVFEDIAVKTALWRELDGLAPAHAIFASNTSSIAIHRLAEAVGAPRRERFVGMHFFSPVPVMPLIELIRGRDTGDETVDAIRDAGGGPRQAGHRLDRSPGLHRQPDPHAVPRRGDARIRGRASAAPRTSMRVPGSASTIRWVRSSWPTSSGSTSASASCASSTTGSAATASARHAA